MGPGRPAAAGRGPRPEGTQRMFLHAIGFGIVAAAVMALAAVGFTVQFGVTNILNLAYGDVMTASAFVAYVSYSAGLNPWWGMVFGAVFSVLLNRFLHTPFSRRGARLFTMIIVTIAVSLILQNCLLAIWGSNFFSVHISVGATVRVLGMVFTATRLTLVAIAAVALAALHGLLRYTRLGKAMRATASAPDPGANTPDRYQAITRDAGSRCWLSQRLRPASPTRMAS
jgi:branched-subunit amino acid ABC-type transport system permease component